MFYVLSQKPVIPPTVSDQIRLWELERDRFKFSDGVLYNQFLSQMDFELLRDYAKVQVYFVVVYCRTKLLGYLQFKSNKMVAVGSKFVMV